MNNEELSKNLSVKITTTDVVTALFNYVFDEIFNDYKQKLNTPEQIELPSPIPVFCSTYADISSISTMFNSLSNIEQLRVFDNYYDYAIKKILDLQTKTQI